MMMMVFREGKEVTIMMMLTMMTMTMMMMMVFREGREVTIMIMLTMMTMTMMMMVKKAATSVI